MSDTVDLVEGRRLLAAVPTFPWRQRVDFPGDVHTGQQVQAFAVGGRTFLDQMHNASALVWAVNNVGELMDEVERLRVRECRLCVPYDFDEHDPTCCPYQYGCCGKACPNCANTGYPSRGTT